MGSMSLYLNLVRFESSESMVRLTGRSFLNRVNSRSDGIHSFLRDSS